MPLSLRIPSDKEQIIRKASAKAGKSKTSFIMEAVDEKLGLHKSREQLIREMAGWLNHERPRNCVGPLRYSIGLTRRTGIETGSGHQYLFRLCRRINRCDRGDC